MLVFVPAVPLKELRLGDRDAALALHGPPVRSPAVPVAGRQLVGLTDSPEHGHLGGAGQRIRPPQEPWPRALARKGDTDRLLVDGRLGEGENVLHGGIATVRPGADQLLRQVFTLLGDVLGVELERRWYPLLCRHLHRSLWVEALVELVDFLGDGRLLLRLHLDAAVGQQLVIQHGDGLAAGHAQHAVLRAQQLVHPLMGSYSIVTRCIVF